MRTKAPQFGRSKVEHLRQQAGIAVAQVLRKQAVDAGSDHMATGLGSDVVFPNPRLGASKMGMTPAHEALWRDRNPTRTCGRVVELAVSSCRMTGPRSWPRQCDAGLAISLVRVIVAYMKGVADGRQRNGMRAIAWLELAVLVLFAWTRVQGYAAHVDLHVADEVFYLDVGRNWMAHGHWPGLGYGPLYCAVVACLHAVLPSSMLPADVLYAGLAIGSSVCLWWALRALVPSPLALLAAAWWTCLGAILQPQSAAGVALPNVYAFGALMMLAVLAALARRKHWFALAMLALLPLARPEAALWIIAIAALQFLLSKRQGSKQRSFLLVAIAVVCAGILMAPSVQERSWVAFSQHYARFATLLELKEAYGITSTSQVDDATALQAWITMQNAFAHPEQVVARDFLGAESIMSAASANPDAFLRFVGFNFKDVFEIGAQALLPTCTHRTTTYWLAGLLIVLASVGWFRYLRGRSTWRAPPRTVWVACLATLTCAASTVWVGARQELLLPLALPMLVCLTGGLAALAPGRSKLAPVVRWGLPVSLFALALLVPGPFAAASSSTPLHRQGLRLLRHSPPPARSLVLCDNAKGFRIYSALRGVRWAQPGGAQVLGKDVNKLLTKSDIDHVLVNALLVQNLPGIDAALRARKGASWHIVAAFEQTVLWRKSKVQ